MLTSPPRRHFDALLQLMPQLQPGCADELQRLQTVLDSFYALDLGGQAVPYALRLAALLEAADDPEATEDCYRRLLAAVPAHTEALNRYGIFLQKQLRFSESCDVLQQAVLETEDFASAWLSLGVGRMHLREFQEAQYCFERTLLLEPTHALARSNLAMCLLMQGRFADGWAQYEARYERPDRQAPIVPPAFPVPRWQGESLHGKRLLIWPEQGLGDQIMCAAWLAALKQRAGVATLVLACSASLVSLFSRLDGVDQVVTTSDAMPLCHFWMGAMSVPHAMYRLGVVDQATGLCRQAPWLRADVRYLPQALADGAAHEHSAGAVLGAGHRPRNNLRRPVITRPLRIGLCWKGSTSYSGDALRSFTLDVYEPLRALPGVQLATLLPGTREQFLAWAGAKALDIGHEIDSGAPAFEETAALLTALDLVVTSDTSIAHLAAALGCRVLVVLNRAGEWRWVAHPAAQCAHVQVLYQTALGDWSSVAQQARGIAEYLLLEFRASMALQPR